MFIFLTLNIHPIDLSMQNTTIHAHRCVTEYANYITTSCIKSMDWFTQHTEACTAASCKTTSVWKKTKRSEWMSSILVVTVIEILSGWGLFIVVIKGYKSTTTTLKWVRGNGLLYFLGTVNQSSLVAMRGEIVDACICIKTTIYASLLAQITSKI